MDKYALIVGLEYSGPPAHAILIAASTESKWIAEHLEQIGHEVLVEDPNYPRCKAPAHRASRPVDAMSQP